MKRDFESKSPSKYNQNGTDTESNDLPKMNVQCVKHVSVILERRLLCLNYNKLTFPFLSHFPDISSFKCRGIRGLRLSNWFTKLTAQTCYMSHVSHHLLQNVVDRSWSGTCFRPRKRMLYEKPYFNLISIINSGKI